MKRALLSREGFMTAFVAATTWLIVMLMPYHAFFSTWLGTLIGPLLVWKSWKEVLLLAAVLVALVFCVRRPEVARQVLKSPLTLLMAAFTALHLLLVLLFAHPLEPTLAGLAMNLRFLALFLLAQLLVYAVPNRAEKLKQFLTASLLVSTAIVSILAILQVTVLPPHFLEAFGYNKDVTIAPYILVDDQAGVLRAFATLRGPNALGQFLLLGLCLLLVLIWRRIIPLKLSLPVFVLALIALLLSGSRSAWLGAALALGVSAFVLLGRVRFRNLLHRYGWLLVLGAAALFVMALTYPPLRLAIFHSSPDDYSITEGSTEKHFAATAQGVQDALSHPLGRGPGQAGPASFYAETPRLAENYYVQLAQEVGVVGLGLFIAILFLVGRKVWQQSVKPQAPPLSIALLASFCGINLINLFLHGWADDPSALVWWGLAGLALQPTTPRE